jgi:hypothetical protein
MPCKGKGSKQGRPGFLHYFRRRRVQNLSIPAGFKHAFHLIGCHGCQSIAFHLIMKKAADILGKHPSDEQILKWGNFIELYCVPKCFIKKEKNP